MSHKQVVDIREDKNNIYVVWQDDEGQREQFGYPLGQGWEVEDENGELACVKHSRKKLEERHDRQTDVDVDSLKDRHVGRKFDLENKEEVTDGPGKGN